MLSRRLGVLCAALLLAVLIALTLSANAGISLGAMGQNYPVLVDPERLFRAVRSDLIATELTLPEERIEQVRERARQDPLADEPFLLAAVESRAEGRFHEALGLLEVARRRDPRNRITRLLLLDGYLREARINEALFEALALDRMREETAVNALLPLVTDLVQNPSISRESLAALAASPLGERVLQELANGLVPPEVILSFGSAPSVSDRMEPKVRQQINALVMPYVRANQWDVAARLYTRFYGLDPEALGQLADPQFKGYPGPPFGWNLSASDGGLVELGPDGLDVVHYGRKNWDIAGQVLLLRPGRHRLSFVTGGADDARTPDLVWRIDCLASKERLLDRPFRQYGFLGQGPKDDFYVPEESCPAQALTLAGRAGETVGSRAMTILSVKIMSEGGR
jgi:tetratricopeptide (TPR) repeat protein